MSLIYGEVESELRNTNLSRLTPISPYFSGSAGRVLFYEDFEDEILRGWNYFDDNETGSYYNLTDTIKFSGKRSLHIRSPQVNTTTNAHLDLIKIFPFTIPTGSNPLIGMEVAFTFSRAFVGLGGPQLRFGLSTWDGTNRRDFYMRYNKGSHLWFWGASETESGSQRLEPYEPATNHCLLFDGGWYRSSHAYVQRWPGGSGRRYHSLCSRSQGTDGCGYTPLPKGILPPEARGGRMAAGGACGMGRRGLSGRDAPANLGYRGRANRSSPGLEI